MNKLSQHEIMNLLVQLSVMLMVGRLFAEMARKIKQPAVIGEILAGIILGPTILGMIQPDWFHSLFPAGSSSLVLDGFVQVAVVMLLFIAGLEVDLHIVLQQGRQAFYTSTLGLIIPFAIGFIFPYFFPEFFGSEDSSRHLAYSLFMGTSMAITALPVIARILMDLNIFKSRMGMLVISSAMINDLIGWLIFFRCTGYDWKRAKHVFMEHDLANNRVYGDHAYHRQGLDKSRLAMGKQKTRMAGWPPLIGIGTLFFSGCVH